MYRFKIQAFNRIGFGPNSTVLNANPFQDVLSSSVGAAVGILGFFSSVMSVCS
jgi:hypothetical protein